MFGQKAFEAFDGRLHVGLERVVAQEEVESSARYVGVEVGVDVGDKIADNVFDVVALPREVGVLEDSQLLM